VSTSPDAAALAAALRELAGRVVVEARDRLAVLRPTVEGFSVVAQRRLEVVTLARRHGFTHVCLELGE
jgi:hypothetical protein